MLYIFEISLWLNETTECFCDPLLWFSLIDDFLDLIIDLPECITDVAFLAVRIMFGSSLQ